MRPVRIGLFLLYCIVVQIEVYINIWLFEKKKHFQMQI